MITIVTIVYTVLWEFPPPPLPALNERIASLIPYGYRRRRDTLSILKTFSLLVAPVPRDIHTARHEEMRSIITKVWNKLDSIPPVRLVAKPFRIVTEQSFGLLPTDPSFVNLLYLGIEGGSRSPFIALYAASMHESFNHSEMGKNSYPQGDSLQCTQLPSPRILRDC